MKIIQAEAIPIKIPLKKPFAIATGTITHTNHVLIRMSDDQGRVGWGESITFHPVYGYDQRALYQVAKDHLIPALIGLDPRNMVELHRRMDQAIPSNLMAKTGLEMAAYDLAGQAAGVPIHLLLGGRRVEAVDQIGPVGLDSPEKAARAAREMIGQGIRTIKIKIGQEAGRDMARVKAVREAVGEGIALRVDGNSGYDRATALATFRRMEESRLEWIEQPLPGWDLEGMAILVKRLETPIAVDESMYTDHDARLCIGLGAAEVVNIKVAKCGGLYRSQKIAAVCKAAGVPCFLGGCLETGVGTAAALHFYAATPNLVSAAEIHGSPFYVDDVVEEPFSLSAGALAVPTSPGLGVKVDEEKVGRYRLTY